MDFGLIDGMVGFRIRLAQIAAFKDFEETLRSFGQAPRYFGLLTLIDQNPGLPQARLAEAVHLVRSSLVPILDKLEAEGLVVRKNSQTDRRTKSVWLTPNGKGVLKKLRPLVEQHEQRLVRGMSDAEREMLVNLLRQIGENLRDAKTARDVA